MTYQALYRKWRPQRFEEMIGQKAITHTLRNAILSGKISHAYLFTGPRGTGKTSAAKIFAKAINCLNSQDGEPCNTCRLCCGITDGTIGDIIEIDAASNNGVEEIRDIRDKARYAPTQATYKVYIIDEVHMLSSGAFNALLKTLEEPPQNVVFVLATTEPHKIPATIISRTQRFDFRRITHEEIIQRLEYVLEQEDIPYEKDALRVIARCANGGMRDALSLLDQVISFGDGQVTLERTIHVSGSLTDEMMIEFVRFLWQGNLQSALLQLQKLLEMGKEASRFIEELLEFSRDILVMRQTNVITGHSDAFNQFKEEVEDSFLYTLIDQLNRAQQEIRFTTKPTICLEVLTIKMSQLKQTSVAISNAKNDESVPIDLLQQKIQELEQKMTQLMQSEQAQSVSPSANGKRKSSSYQPNLNTIYKILEQASRDQLNLIRGLWHELLQMLLPAQRALLQASEPVAASSTAFVLKFDYEILCQRAEENPELHQDIAKYCQQLAQYQGEFTSVTGEQWQKIRKEYLLDKKKKRSEEQVTHATVMEETEIEAPASEIEQLVENTIQLFGEEIVQITEETDH